MPLTADQVAAVGRAVKRTKRGIKALRGKGAARQHASRLASYRRDLAALEEMLVEPQGIDLGWDGTSTVKPAPMTTAYEEAQEWAGEPPPPAPVSEAKHNCWTFALAGPKIRDGYVYATCASPSEDAHYWVTKQVLGEREMPLVDADNCPGWEAP